MTPDSPLKQKFEPDMKPWAPKYAGFSNSNIINEIYDDPSIPSYRKQQLISDLERAEQLHIDLSPGNLMMAGFGALAGWLTSKFFAAGPVGQFIGASIGAWHGYKANQPSKGTIVGDGYYQF